MGRSCAMTICDVADEAVLEFDELYIDGCSH
jgi:hypothetical protein